MDRARKITLSSNGFTIIELLVVMAIMVVLVGLFTVNLAGQRASRDMRVAQNELVTNLRRIQSNTLAGRKAASVNQPVKYYLAKFNLSTSTTGSYTLQAMYKDEIGIWKLADVETVKFPTGVALSNIQIKKLDGALVPSTCALVAFQVPFARIYMNDGCGLVSPITNPYSLKDGDDYKKIVNFVNNTAGLTTTYDSKMYITIIYRQDPSTAKTVEINGITGAIGF